MKELAKETYGKSLHIWYEAELLADHAYGKIFNTEKETGHQVAACLLMDLQKYQDQAETYWYMGPSLDQILLMVRYRDEKWTIQVNLKDFDFALHLDAVEVWKKDLISQLVSK